MAIVTIQAPSLSDIQKKRVGERILDSLHSEGVPASSIVVLFRPEDTDIFLDGGLLFEARSGHHGASAAPPSTVTTVSKKPSVMAVAAAAAPAPPPHAPPPVPHAPAARPHAPAAKSHAHVTRPHAPAPPQPHVAAQVAPSAPAAKGRGRGGRGAQAPRQASQKPLPSYADAKGKIRAMLLNHGGLSSFQAQTGLDLKGHDGASALLRRIFADLEMEGLVEKQGQKRGTRYVLKGIATTPMQPMAPVKLVKQDRPEEAQGMHGFRETHHLDSDFMGS
jgi:hypothetical protein